MHELISCSVFEGTDAFVDEVLVWACVVVIKHLMVYLLNRRVILLLINNSSAKGSSTGDAEAASTGSPADSSVVEGLLQLVAGHG